MPKKFIRKFTRSPFQRKALSLFSHNFLRLCTHDKGVQMAPQQRVATKDDYIYIPLKGPPVNATPSGHKNGAPAANLAKSNSLTSKPPLPKQPPRVVHASVKKELTTQASAAATSDADKRHRRRRTIDSAGVQLPMEPMGLIETDLDTEVTVITSGDAKTRSLLNLGPEPRLSLAPDDAKSQTRPHKSMEFLLDKQNLKVVEVSESF
ncbi:hypothetical protein NQ317_015092 [Molorchus minor]|uniref:Uncharacterized protein n=1 Tax=Molorchus minor TaxID=1323400 RepID=A0ABQ9K4S2_9CUCU|nr:hypothetical protein NQ317_015092 [Molorchus minor]